MTKFSLVISIVIFGLAENAQAQHIKSGTKDRACVTVLVYNYVHVPTPIMKVAREIAAQLIGKADVELEWRIETQPHTVEIQGGQAPRQNEAKYPVFILPKANASLQEKGRTLGIASTEDTGGPRVLHSRLNRALSI